MQNLTLQQLFGNSAYQDADYLVINKGDFINLTASSTNTGESLLAAILLNAHTIFEGTLTDELGNNVTNENNVPITFNNSNLYELLNITFWKTQYIAFKNNTYVLNTYVIETYAVK